MYQPAEDSWLLLETIQKLNGNFKRGLDMGTGTGILAQELAKRSKQVVGADVDAESLEYARKNVKAKNIAWLQSDLFDKIRGKFDLIVFNSPYLPPEDDGGREYSGGVPLIIRFLERAKGHLALGGRILLLFSSRTGMDIKAFGELGYRGKKVVEKKLFFEVLWVWELRLTTT